ncbi:DSBA-like thioredoxin domain-containing protein [Lineolata rhizophorae]|uniref:DSBA-like thioredoxin domain-containing protein n=1 Tax=Lineolata rhizophorae TaxID=578093 RepID=A0A6A6P082_9PEZI|nr:DSBA-like thioredoxin domain-containing protein [Lineolata rhizophorae]
MTKFDIRIVSDVVCPWCYVGKKRLEKGIELFREAHPDSNDTFTTTWYPFYLNPDAPITGIDKKEMYDNKFGPERTRMMFARLSAIGEAEGINFKFGGRTGNTRNAHRLVQLGKTKGPDVQTKIVEALFEAYFENEKDITDEETLVSAGVKAGIEESEVKDWLKSGKGGKDVDSEVTEANSNMITGVPHFTLQDQYEVEGAQDPQAFTRLFELIKARNL